MIEEKTENTEQDNICKTLSFTNCSPYTSYQTCQTIIDTKILSAMSVEELVEKINLFIDSRPAKIDDIQTIDGIYVTTVNILSPYITTNSFQYNVTYTPVPVYVHPPSYTYPYPSYPSYPYYYNIW